LQERKALFVESTYTASNYRLFALPNTTPPKPGLIRTESTGAEIIVELWDVPLQHFGSFVALIPAPLGIGTLSLHDGREVKGFICEGAAVNGATDITHLGGWRAYIKSLQK
jgi:allophanate hydrolase